MRIKLKKNGGPKMEILNKSVVINERPDSLEIGTPAKGGAVKVYTDFLDKGITEQRIKAAFEARKYAQSLMGDGI